ncbi:hypothetical protein [Vibrio sagamiensis]|uniref:Lipoprotein n=2 Tax=Vibrio sagamiensis TaxID=512650 RepID=A0A511QDR2_9VIBR|nr:hypothetical protein [Vibrio sagamiensis]GEM75444.1 hypothetical protein VSA01S_15560 [Vibrio sagamiensis NBRC 104589]
MNKIIKILSTILIMIFMSGCQSTSNENIVPTASKGVIEAAKENLDGKDFFKINKTSYTFEVTEDGVIKFYEYLPRSGFYVWDSVQIKNDSFTMACEYFRDYLNLGMVMQIQFVGRRGRVETYDNQRCEDLSELMSQ